jgi:hypothetical protein
MKSRPVIFDTSAINRLADDEDASALLAGLRAAFFIRITETNVSEIVATTSSARRARLLDVVQSLLPSAHCIQPYQWIIDRLAVKFNQSPGQFRWERFSVRFPACEREIVRRSVVDDDLALRQRREAQRAAQEFNAIYNRVAPTLQALGNGAACQTLHEYVEAFKKGNGPLWGIGQMLCARATSTEWSERSVMQFYDDCPPFRALLVALCVAEYERCLRDSTEPTSLRVGRFDLLMATYLPYCHQFVTADERQLNCLRLVATEAHTTTIVRSYEDFREGLTGTW